MGDPSVLKFVGAPVYEGKPGWPAKDLTQEELDARGLDKAVMLAYRPKLYEEVETRFTPDEEEKRANKKSRRRHRRADPPVQPGEGADEHQGDDDDGGGAGESLHPGTGEPGED